MSSSTPFVQIWNRLEPRPRTNSYTRSVRAEVRDALWMITRQWQFGELNAEDTGTAAMARIDMQTTHIDRIAKKSGTSRAVNTNVPLECLVERENIKPDLLHCIELGRQFLKMLLAGLTSTDYNTTKTALEGTTILQFTIPSPLSSNPEFSSSSERHQVTQTIINCNAFNGYEIIKRLKAAQAVSSFVTLSSPLDAAVNSIGTAFLAWYNRVYSEPASGENYWLNEHLEYQFACSAPKSGTDYTVLNAEEYYQGHLDWYSFDIQDTNSQFSTLKSGSPDITKIENKPFTVIPAKISFGGMPAPRYWEMEDRRVDFGNMSTTTTDTAQMLVAEFATIYSNDWTLIPYTVPTGTICNLRKILVTDVFGQTTYIKAACEPDWTMYTLSANGASTGDTRLFVPPVVMDMEESEPIEAVNLMRDEIANMVWGVETIVPGAISGGQSGKDAAQQLTTYLESVTAPIPPSFIPNAAEIKFNIMNSVPENWIPYIPVNLNNALLSRQIQFQRAAMPRRILNNLPGARVRPRTSLLQANADPSTNSWPASYIFEEEIPRSGAILSVTWQRARWHNGQVALWLGKRKQNGRGEGNSGLRFDYLTPKEADQIISDPNLKCDLRIINGTLIDVSNANYFTPKSTGGSSASPNEVCGTFGGEEVIVLTDKKSISSKNHIYLDFTGKPLASNFGTSHFKITASLYISALNSDSNYGTIFGKDIYGANFDFGLVMSSLSNFVIYSNGTGTNITNNSASPALTTGTWHNLTYEYNNGAHTWSIGSTVIFNGTSMALSNNSNKVFQVGYSGGIVENNLLLYNVIGYMKNIKIWVY